MTVVTLKSRYPDELQLELQFGKGGRPGQGHSACKGRRWGWQGRVAPAPA